ncbi:PHP domain-containing protein [Fusibacter ferrireducens]|uniref:Polymerase/histidinol phosphatase N-terminal domain-containing protein n=1 Tax=Fusibacter ferrireducens TaxID=2785058 RepID=A0ABR9ZW55_9FIRM|nr:hypothetical protein [Fusibacter ferrireducens]MBF4694368.1 hypothetical protein [Fusibacter ferrireducens]
MTFNAQIKGNIHCHTTRTDGECSVEAIQKLYKAKTYAFLAITDHRIYFDEEGVSRDLILLNGCEYNCYLDHEAYDERIHFHLLTLKDPEQDVSNRIEHDDNSYKSLFYTKLDEVQDLIDELRSRGNLVIIAHPKNPFIPIELLKALRNYDGIEVYNAKSGQDASDYLFELYQMRKTLLFTSVDDSHALLDDQGACEYFKGYIVVEDSATDKNKIVKAIKSKRFYASNGPEIYSLAVDENQLTLQCSAVSKIELTVFSEEQFETICFEEKDTLITALQYQFSKAMTHYSMICIDDHGKKAWISN